MENLLFKWYWNNYLTPKIRKPYFQEIRRKYDYANPAPTLVTSNCVGGGDI